MFISSFKILIFRENEIKNGNTETDYEIVRAVEKKTTNSPFECPYCYTIKKPEQFRRHIRFCSRRPEEVRTWYKCQDCAYKTERTSDLKKHGLRHAVNESNVFYSCDQCSFRTKHKNYLKKHASAIHSDVSYKCDVCDYVIKHKSYLKQHKKIHKAMNEVNVFRCKLCNHQTKFRSYMKTHMLTHKTKEEITKWYKCDECDKEFKSQSVLWCHKRSHWGDSKKKHKCVQCSFRTYDEYLMKRHMVKHMNLEDVKEWFKCEQCSKQFKYKG